MTVVNGYRLPSLGYGWFRHDFSRRISSYGSLSRARSEAKRLLGSFHVAIIPVPGRRFEVWYSEIKSSEGAKGSRYLDFTKKRR